MILKSLKFGFSQLWQYKKIWFILYALTLLLAMFVAYPLHQYLDKKVGNSLIINDIVEGFNYTFYADFMNHYGDGISPILNQSFYLIILYLILFIFLTGGIVKTFIHRPHFYSPPIFWSNCATYFGKIFRLSIYFFIIHGIILTAFLVIFSLITSGLSPTNLENEGIIFIAIKYMTPIYILFASFFFLWQDYTKICLVKNEYKWIFQAMKDTLVFIKNNFRKAFGLYLLNMLLLGLVFTINYFITSTFEINSSNTILLSFFLSQLFIITRLGLKLINLSSAAHLYFPLEKTGY
ncbi:MAG: hypothetical protein ACI94Y_002158 [Maribacter sp.]|jgi:hypothetical protein